jgi:hypothetical protein
MRNVLILLLFAFISINSANAQYQACIKVNGKDPIGGALTFCQGTRLVMTTWNCGSSYSTVSGANFQITWSNLTTGATPFTGPTNVTFDAGEWQVRVQYRTSSSVIFEVYQTVTISFYPTSPFNINNGDAAAAHCPESEVTLTATQNNTIVGNYKWYNSFLDTNATVIATGPVLTTALFSSSITVSATNTYGCTVMDNINVPSLPQPAAFTLGADKGFCPGGNVTIGIAQRSNETYSWNNGTFSNTNNWLIVNTPGQYILTIQLGVFCKRSDTINIIQYPAPAINSIADTTVCYGTDAPLNAQVSGGTAPFNYAWTPVIQMSNASIASPIFDPGMNNASLINLTVSDANNCSDTESLTITQAPDGNSPYLSLGVGNNIAACGGDPAIVNAQALNSYSSTFTYAWVLTGGGSINNTTGNPIEYTPDFMNPSASLALTVTDDRGCIETKTIAVGAYDNPVALANVDVTTACKASTINLSGSGTGGSPGYTFSWSPTEGISNPTNATTTVTTSESKDYILTLTDLNGCKDTAKVTIDVVDPEIVVEFEDTTVFANNPITISPLLPPGFTLLWENTTTGQTIGTAPTWTVSQGGVIKVSSVTSIPGCTTSDIFTVEFVEGDPYLIYIPNAFNPASSNKENNTVKVYGIGIQEEDFLFRIYNRWGTVIYENDSFMDASTKGWIGEDTGANQKQEVYTYTVVCKFFDGTEGEKTGTITLIR